MGFDRGRAPRVGAESRAARRDRRGPRAGAPHREALARALEAEGVRWECAVEAQGWDLFAHFARLGMGVAVVNDFVRAPPGLYARPPRGLPPVTYRVLRRRGATLTTAAESLRTLLLARSK